MSSATFAPVPRAPGPRWLPVVLAAIGVSICASLSVRGWHQVHRQQHTVGGIHVGAGLGDYFAALAPIVLALLVVHALLGRATSFGPGEIVSRLWTMRRRIPLSSLTAVQLKPQTVPRQPFKFREPVLALTGRTARGRLLTVSAQRFDTAEVCRFLDDEVRRRPAVLADDFTRSRWQLWADPAVTAAERRPFWDPRTVVTR